MGIRGRVLWVSKGNLLTVNECPISDATSDSLRSSSSFALILANSLPNATATPLLGRARAMSANRGRAKRVRGRVADRASVNARSVTVIALSNPTNPPSDTHALLPRLGYRLQHFLCSAQSLAVIKFEVPFLPIDPDF